MLQTNKHFGQYLEACTYIYVQAGSDTSHAGTVLPLWDLKLKNQSSPFSGRDRDCANTNCKYSCRKAKSSSKYRSHN